LLTSLLLTKCAKVKGIATDVEVRDFVWKGLNAYYLYQDQITDLSDRRFSSDQELNAYLRGFPDASSLFNSLLLPTDNKSSLVEDFNTLTPPSLRTSFTNGMEFGIIENPNDTDLVFGYVMQISPNSDAATKNMHRGDFFTEVDGEQLTKTNYQSLLANISYTLTLADVVLNNGVLTITTNATTVDLTKNTYNHPPIFLEKTFTIGAKKIGYLMYQNDFSDNYINDLNNTLLNFKNQQVNELILDLRYNIGTGGYAKTVTQLASMLTGQFPTNETLIKKKWNAKAQPWFEAHQPDSLLIKFPEKLNATTNFAKLNLTDVYIILNGNNFTGSSFTELLINSLKPYINVHVIGNQTIGNNTGRITLYNSIDYDSIGKSPNHTFALQPVVLTFENNDDQGYANGISPEIQLCSVENFLHLGVLGENSDPILNNTLNYITTGSVGITPPCNVNNFIYLYNSISAQRPADNGMFFKQDLPNTDNRATHF